MELKNYKLVYSPTQTTRFILPFLFKNNFYFCDRFKFVNAFSYDINKPYYNNHIFILFKYDTECYNAINHAMTTNPYFHNKLTVHIENSLYLEYIFVISNFKDEINLIKDGYCELLSLEDKNKIFKFWNCNNLFFIKELFIEKNDLLERKTLEELGEAVPEIIYIENELDEWYKNIIKKPA